MKRTLNSGNKNLRNLQTSGDELSRVAPQASSFKHYTHAYLPWIRVDKASKMSSPRMDEVTVTSTATFASGTSSLPPGVLSQIAGEVAAILRGPSTSTSNPLSVSTEVSADAITVTTTLSIHSYSVVADHTGRVPEWVSNNAGGME